MKASIHIAFCAALLTLGACATIVEGSTDSINVITSPSMNANCNLTNTRGTYSTYTPAPASVKKSISDLNVVCNDPSTGANGSSVLASEVEPWAFGNVLIGGLIGAGIDWSTGAAYNYPNSVSVPMVVPAPVAAAPETVVPAPADAQVMTPFLGTPPAAIPAFTAPAAPAPSASH